jgi:signal transduction histidine kinase
MGFRVFNIFNGLLISFGGLYFHLFARKGNSQLLKILSFYIASVGLAATFIGISHRWDLLWWAIHILRILLTFIAIYYMLLIFRQALYFSVVMYKSLGRQNKRLVALNQQILDQQKALEEQRIKSIHSARMASIGQLAGNVAHEINSPLAALLLTLEFMQSEIPPEKGVTASINIPFFNDTLTKSQKLAMRIADVVRGLLNLAREGESKTMLKTSVESVVRNAIDICEAKFKAADIELIVDPISEIFITCRSGQISQVFLNLLLNSFDAVRDLETRWVRLSVSGSANDVRIHIVDSGQGLPPEIASHIMEPFFTTKDVNQGTGLGLSVSKLIVEEHHGNIYYDSHAKNTTFTVTLPRSDTRSDK